MQEHKQQNIGVAFHYQVKKKLYRNHRTFETIQKNFLFDQRGPLIPNINWSGISLPSVEFHIRQEHEQEKSTTEMVTMKIREYYRRIESPSYMIMRKEG